jgi:hypothetical protein
MISKKQLFNTEHYLPDNDVQEKKKIAPDELVLQIYLVKVVHCRVISSESCQYIECI